MAPLNDAQRSIVRKLEKFANCTLAASGHKRNTSADTATRCGFVGPVKVLEQGGIQLVEPLSDRRWRSFCSNIDKNFDNSLTEGAGVHPTVRRLFDECNRLSGSIYGIVYETNYEDLEDIMKRPDISIVIKGSAGKVIETIVVPVEIKKFDNLSSAIHQAMGYLVCKLRNWLDLYGFGGKLHGFCVGTDGLSLAIGHVSIENDVLRMFSTGDDPIPFWSNEARHNDPNTYPPKETQGVRVLRSLLSKNSHELLGHIASEPLPHKVGKFHFYPSAILGRGAFCTALLAKVAVVEAAVETKDPDEDLTEESLEEVVLKMESIVSLSSHLVPLEQLSKECGTFKLFASSDCPNLPRLIASVGDDWKVTVSSAFIPMLPIGEPLDVRCAGFSPSERLTEALMLHKHITAGLRAAHALGHCHRDMRPENVVYDRVKECYVVIDWGLAEPPGALMHGYHGCKPYCHDDIVEAMNNIERIPFRPEHDLATTRYIAYVFSRGPSFNTRGWSTLNTSFIPTRARIVGDFCEY